VKADLDAIDADEVVVVGAGAAGLMAALLAAPRRVTLVAQCPPGSGAASVWAQGGVAAAVGADDSPRLHAADTLAAGAGLCDPEAVRLLVEEGPRRIAQVSAWGARFDRQGTGRGEFALGREAAHSRRRILHTADSTGAELVRALGAAVRAAAHVRLVEARAEELVVEGGRLAGIIALDPQRGRVFHHAAATVLATGGIGRVYAHTTNPPEAGGDGLAMAARAGVGLADLEMVQFHPTALAVGADPMPLLTEALRGEGAILVDGRGRRFLVGEHPSAELGPRDVVARAIWRTLAAGEPVFLDCRGLGDRLAASFPTVCALAAQHGLDPARDPLPVAPAAHYHMGGVAVDLDGRTSLAGLWACGEVAATGVHGANRLASNSLLEAIVYGARVGEALRREPPRRSPGRLARRAAEELRAAAAAGGSGARPVAADELRRRMWQEVGLVRGEAGLRRTLAWLTGPAGRELAAHPRGRNLWTVARLIAGAALLRRESRGAHFRDDFPAERERWRRRLRFQLAAGGDPPALVPAAGGAAAGACR
jgi:L-aspartate oxidase